MKKLAVLALVFLLPSLLTACATPGGSSFSPEDADRYYSLAIKAAGNEDYASTVDYCTRTIKANPRHRDAYKLRGATYGLQKQYDKGIADFEKAIALAPDDAQAVEGRGLVRMHKALANPDDSGSVDLLKLAVMDLLDACDKGSRSACKTLEDIKKSLGD